MLVIFVIPTGTNEICSNETIIAFRKTISLNGLSNQSNNDVNIKWCLIVLSVYSCHNL